MDVAEDMCKGCGRPIRFSFLDEVVNSEFEVKLWSVVSGVVVLDDVDGRKGVRKYCDCVIWVLCFANSIA